MRHHSDGGKFNVAFGSYSIMCCPVGLPSLYDEYKKHAVLVEEPETAATATCCVAVTRAGEPWPFLVIARGYEAGRGAFDPGLLLVPETHRLFFGAGEWVSAYSLDTPARVWEDYTSPGFWGWLRHGEVVVMSAELELAGFDLEGRKLWSASVEPEWGHTVEGEVLHLEVMGVKSSFRLRTGPAQ